MFQNLCDRASLYSNVRTGTPPGKGSLVVTLVQVRPLRQLLGGLLVAGADADARGKEQVDARARQAVAVHVQVLQAAQVGARGQDDGSRVGDAAVPQVQHLQPPQDTRIDDLPAARVAHAAQAQ